MLELSGRLGTWGLGLITAAVWMGVALAAADPPPKDSEPAPPTAAEQQQLMQLYEKMVRYNLDNDHVLPSADIDSLMIRFMPLSLGDRVAAWADYFWQRGDVIYRFGLASGGYASDGRLVDDFRTDCILFFYRVTELGRSSNALEAVQFAYGTRFYGASLQDVVGDDGRVDYDAPAHLDYTIDILRSGIWGSDISASVGRCVPDTQGSTRYEPGSVYYVPKAAVNHAALRSGDIVFLLGDEQTETGKRLREAGALIGHVGIVRVENGVPHLIHPASKPLPGVYEGGKLVKVPLRTYLDRVETFKGILVTRIDDI
jgi:hypothetical protein